MKKEVDVAIIGAGSAGLFALSKVRRETNNFVLINGGETGTTCSRVGCMPSKVMIQVAEDFHRRKIFDREGITGADALGVDIPDVLEYIRDLRDVFVDQVLSSSTDQMGEEFIEGYARFVEPDVLQVNDQFIRARRIIIATGSRPFVPSAWQAFGDRIVTTDSLFELEDLPGSMAVIGMGAVGLELGQALHRLGITITGIEQLDTVGGLIDPASNQIAVAIFGKEFPLWLGHAAEISTTEDGRLLVSSGDREVTVDKVLASLGRIPNLEDLNLDVLDTPRDERGIPLHDPHTMQINGLPVFIAGDATGDRAILHEAGDEGRIAGFNAVQDSPAAFLRKPSLSIAFCDPNIVLVGASLDELDENSIAVSEIRLGPVGRALIMGRNKGALRLYADRVSGKLLGASMVVPQGEHIGHLLAWALQQEMTVHELYKMPFYHPAIEEALQACLKGMIGDIEAQADELLEMKSMGID